MSENKFDQPNDEQNRLPQSEELESLFEEFESAWVKTPYPDIRSYLDEHSTQGSTEFRTTILVELIQIDLERRWKTDAEVPVDSPLPAQPKITDYTAAFPEIGSVDDVPVELLAFEFRVRQLWGDSPEISEFVAQFPNRGDALQSACEKGSSNLSMQQTQYFPRDLKPETQNEAAQSNDKSKAAEQSFRSLSEGMQISHYLLRRQIGKGGFGIVFEADNLDRPYQKCAIKLIRPDRVARPNLAARFKQEITALTVLAHPNIACATDHGEWQGVVYLVLEYVDGRPVNKLVRRKPQMSVAEACELIRQAAVGLQHIHEKQRTHRDIKPSNLMVTTDGTVKILDLGLARLTDIEDQEERLTSLGDVMGTPDYMAPEQWQDASNVDIRGDVYSLGCTLYCLLAGQPPFASTSQFDPVALMRAHSESPIPNVAAHRNDVPEEVQKLITECMAKERNDRPATPQEIAARLTPFSADASLVALAETQEFPTKEAIAQAATDETAGLPDAENSDNPAATETLIEPATSDAAAASAVTSLVSDSTTDEAAETCEATDVSSGATFIETAGTQPVSEPPKEASITDADGDLPQAAGFEETHIETVETTKSPSLEETLIQQGVDPNGTLSEQTIKPQGRTRTSGSQSSGSTSSMSRSYSQSGSVVLTPRQVTYGKVTGVDDAEYEIGAMLGQGGMGAVYRARQGSVDRGVALKMVKKDQATADAQEKFLAEAVVTGALEHPNIVPIYDLGVNTSEELFYAMKEVQGHPWTDSIDKVSLDENLDVIIKVTDAIAFSHEKGIVHRDLKPDNIMIGEFGEVVVMDWGLALPTEKFEKQGMPITEGLAGTPSYMAPEMADLSLGPIGPAADIYLLGAQLFRAVTKVVPHTGKHAYAALQAAAANTIQWPEDSTAHDEELLSIARKAMATRPEDRYASALDFKQALKDYRCHSESRRLTSAARDELDDAETTSNYRSFERAVASLEEAIKLWRENDSASQLLQKARLRYAQAAFQKGDLDLAEGQLDEHDLAHAELLKSIRETRTEREAQAKRLRRMRQTAASLAAVVFLTVSVSAVLINSARKEEKLAKEQEAIAKTEAVQRFRDSESAIAELSGLADSLRDYPMAQAERQKLLEAVTSYYDRQTSEQSDVPELRHEQVHSLLRLGEVQNQLAEFSDALTTWDRTLAMARKLPPALDHGTVPHTFVASALAGQARTQFALGDFSDARKSNDEAISEYKAASVDDVFRFAPDIAALLTQQALIEKSDGQYPEALELIESATRLLVPRENDAQAESLRQKLAVSLGVTAQIQELMGEYTEAAAASQTAALMWENLSTKNPDRVDYVDGLATSQIDSANIQRAAGFDPLTNYEKGVEAFQQLVELRPGIPRYRFNLASALTGKAWIQNRLLQTEAAQETAVQAVNILLFLSERFPEDVRFPLAEVTARLVLAEVLRDRGDLDLAVGIIEQASEVLRREDISPDLPQSRERYGELVLIYGQVQAAFGDPQLALDTLRQSSDALIELADGESGLPRHRDSAAWALSYLAKQLADEDPDAARSAIESAIEQREQLPERANWMESFAWLLLHCPVEDLRDAERAAQLATTAMNQAPENPRFLRTLALARLRLGKVDEAVETLSKDGSPTNGTHPEHQLLSAIIAFRQQRPDEAASLMAKASATIRKIASANPRLLQFQQEAEAVTGIVIPVSEDGEAAEFLPTN